MGYTVWTLRCPRCKGLNSIYKEDPLITPFTKCTLCGEMSTAKAWKVAAMEYRTPEPKPLSKCFVCGAVDCELDHVVA